LALQFAAKDDPFLPWKEQLAVAEGLQAELEVVEGGGHFMCGEFERLAALLEAKLQAARGAQQQ
jgi:predicted alpha/beta hydrolase family esterase